MIVKRVAVLPGDGIGPEVVAEGVKALRAVEARLKSVRFELEEFSVGAGEYLRSGDALPAATLARLREHDTLLLGAMGLPEVRRPDGLELTPQIDLREKLDLFLGLRPVRLIHPQDTPLRPEIAGPVDLLLIREQTEGLFAGRGERRAAPDRVEDVLRVTREGSLRLFRAAFRRAEARRRHVTLVDKANVLPSMAFFRKIFDEVAAEFPTVRTDRVYVDAMALHLLRRPHAFDVVVTENMFGDILSDLAAGLVGGMGMAPSADIGPRHAVFQPVHGSAPDIAGKGVANPVATILSVALLCDEGGPELAAGGTLIRAAVEAVLANPSNRTRDLGGSLTTAEMGERIARAIQRPAASPLR